ncbi:MAG: tetratricopeptide repeat protein [bacterium]
MKVFISTVTVLFLVAIGDCRSTLPRQIDSLVVQGIQLSMLQSYSDAIDIFTGIQDELPDHPAGYFFHAAVVQTRMMDFEHYDQEERFLSLIDTTIELAKQKIKRDKDDAWAYFFLGGGYGYLSFYRAKQKKFWEAFHTARYSVEALQIAVAKDSTLYDAYLGLGTYKYYRSRYSRYLSWLPLISDEREGGIDLIKVAMTKSRFSRYGAINGICWIFVEEKRYQEGLAIAESVLRDYPDSRVFLWCAAKLCKKLQRWHEAAKYYERILASLHRQGIQSPVNELTCRKNLSHIYSKLQQHDRARQQCEMASIIHLDKKTKKQCSQTLQDIAETCAAELNQAWPVE